MYTTGRAVCLHLLTSPSGLQGLPPIDGSICQHRSRAANRGPQGPARRRMQFYGVRLKAVLRARRSNDHTDLQQSIRPARCWLARQPASCSGTTAAPYWAGPLRQHHDDRGERTPDRHRVHENQGEDARQGAKHPRTASAASTVSMTNVCGGGPPRPSAAFPPCGHAALCDPTVANIPSGGRRMKSRR